MNILPTARTSEIILSELQDELVIYDLSINKAFCLNKTSAIVYKECNGSTTFAEMKLKYAFTDDLIFLALDQLKAENLLADDADFKTHFVGKSRREAIRTIGLTTMIALPLVSSLIAPNAVEAQSGCSCPSTEPVGCQLGGTYSIGCFPTTGACFTAGFASGGTIEGNHCCNLAATVNHSAASKCCTVVCNL